MTELTTRYEAIKLCRYTHMCIHAKRTDAMGNKRDKREPVARKSLFLWEVGEVIIEGRQESEQERTCVAFTLDTIEATFHTARGI